MDLINEMFQRQARRIEAQVVQQAQDHKTMELVHAKLVAVHESIAMHNSSVEQHTQRLLWTEEATQRMQDHIGTMNSEHQKAMQFSNALYRDVQDLRSQLQREAPERYRKIRSSLSDISSSSISSELSIPSTCDTLVKRDGLSTDSSDGHGGMLGVQPTGGSGGSGSPGSGDGEALAASASDEAVARSDDSDGLPNKVRRRSLEKETDTSSGGTAEVDVASQATSSEAAPIRDSSADDSTCSTGSSRAANSLPWYSVAACAAPEERVSWAWPNRDTRRPGTPHAAVSQAAVPQGRLHQGSVSTLQQGPLPFPPSSKVACGDNMEIRPPRAAACSSSSRSFESVLTREPALACSPSSAPTSFAGSRASSIVWPTSFPPSDGARTPPGLNVSKKNEKSCACGRKDTLGTAADDKSSAS
ncbi:MAG: hypothetical protein SGPRY_010662, partial [Prymnesium sp.]